jgi:hypothetical protein
MFRRRKQEPVAPGQDAVAGRLLCISVVTMLGAIAAAVAEGTADEEQAAEYVTESHRWLIREKLVEDLSGGERALIAKELAEWTPQEQTNAGWRNESLGVLLWALSALDEIPPYDAGFERLPALVPLLAPTADFRARASLRPPEVIGRARDIAELWHWRARTRQLQERGELQGDGHDLDAITRQAAALAQADGSIPQPIDEDFPAYGKPYRELDSAEYASVTSSAVERHYALNWLCGYASDWDCVPTDT